MGKMPTEVETYKVAIQNESPRHNFKYNLSIFRKIDKNPQENIDTGDEEVFQTPAGYVFNFIKEEKQNMRKIREI